MYLAAAQVLVCLLGLPRWRMSSEWRHLDVAVTTVKRHIYTSCAFWVASYQLFCNQQCQLACHIQNYFERKSFISFPINDTQLTEYMFFSIASSRIHFFYSSGKIVWNAMSSKLTHTQGTSYSHAQDCLDVLFIVQHDSTCNL